MKQREIDQIKRPKFTKPEVRRGMASLGMELPDGRGLDKLVADVNKPLPLTSIGPSGIGGEYQSEVKP